jgi:hypothetical protein
MQRAAKMLVMLSGFRQQKRRFYFRSRKVNSQMDHAVLDQILR